MGGENKGDDNFGDDNEILEKIGEAMEEEIKEEVMKTMI